MKKPLLVAIPVLAILAVAAYWGHRKINTLPTFINHPRPLAKVNSSGFIHDSCTLEKFQTESCTPEKTLRDLGCQEILKADDLIGGLVGAEPVAKCYRYFLEGKQPNSDEILYPPKGMLQAYVCYAIQRPDGYAVLKTREDFKRFTPLKTKEQALGYVLAVTDLRAYYRQSFHFGMFYAVNTVEDTYVKEVPGGFFLHLFDERIFGCGPHWTSSVDVFLSRDGSITELSRNEIYRKLAEDGMCVD